MSVIRAFYFLFLVSNVVFADSVFTESDFDFIDPEFESSIISDIAVGDIDGDGDDDIVVAHLIPENPPRLISGNRIWLNNGDNTFTLDTQIIGERNTSSIALFDIDNDGDLDLYSANFDVQFPEVQPEVTGDKVWLNDGFGNFTDSGLNIDIGSSDSIAVGDVNNDNYADLVVIDRADHLYVLMNDFVSSGGFIESEIPSDDLFTYFGSLHRTGLVDIDGDLDLDIITNDGPEPIVLLNDGSGVFAEPTIILNLFGLSFDGTDRIVSGDFNGDGAVDLLVDSIETSSFPDSIEGLILLNDGLGNFSSHQEIFDEIESGSIVVEDIDLDGDVDILANIRIQFGNGQDGIQASVLLNDGSANFTIEPLASTTNHPQIMALIDSDGDDDPDLVGNFSWLYNLDLFLNNALDFDSDGVPNSEDNCPSTFNPSQEDENLNGIGDLCEPMVPGVAVLISPLDSVNTASPTFEWHAVDGASRYRISVYDRALGENVYNRSQVATEVCIASICSLTPDIALGYSTNHFWRVRAWNAQGWGEWTTRERFDRLPEVPGIASVIAPLGGIGESSPTFEWQPVLRATRYRVQVYDRLLGETVVNESYEAGTICTEVSCSLFPGVSLGISNSHTWRVRAWNVSGWGAWTSNQRFGVLPELPGVTTLIAPLDMVTTESPVFQWQAVEAATRYRLQVYDSALGASVHNESHEAGLICVATVCTLNPDISLGISGDHFWRVRAWNSQGWGEWTERERFDRLP